MDIRFDEQITDPGKQFNVKSSGDMWIVSLKDPKSVQHRTIKRKSIGNKNANQMAYQKRRRTENLFLSKAFSIENLYK